MTAKETKQPGKSIHTWEYTRYFRRGAYKWKGTALASKRITAAIREIKAVSKSQPEVAAEGIAVFFEKCWPALEHIDSSSGAIGIAVDKAIAFLTELFGSIPLGHEKSYNLINRIWQSWQDEDYGYYDILSERWPVLCRTPAMMAVWIDEFLPFVSMIFSDKTPGAFFKGSEPCLACLVAVGRYDDVFELLSKKKNPFFYYHQYEAYAYAAQGRIDEAMKLISPYLSDPSYCDYAAAAGERMLLGAGREQQAYKQFGLIANTRTTGLATFSAIHKKYPVIPPAKIITDLMMQNPGSEGKYFAAARKAGCDEIARTIADTALVDPRTLYTASKDLLSKSPRQALYYGLMSLLRYAQGGTFEFTGMDVLKVKKVVHAATEAIGCEADTKKKIDGIISKDVSDGKLVSKVLNSNIMETLNRIR